MSTTTEKHTPVNVYPKYHNPINIHEWDKTKLSWKVEKTRDAGEVIGENGDKVKYEEKWQVIPYYTYPDGKTDRLQVTYDACPIHTYESTDNGRKRKMIARYHRERRVYTHIQQMVSDLNLSGLEFIFRHDCSIVLGAWEVSVVDGKKVAKATYSEFIRAHIAGQPHVTIGEKQFVTADIYEAFLEEFTTSLRDNVISKDDPAHPEYQPCKFIDVTGFPKGPKSTSDDDMKKFERMKVEGITKITFFCSEETVKVIKYDQTLSDDAWIVSKNGTEYTTDYLVWKKIKAGHEAYVALTFLIQGFRMSVSKKGKKSLALEEECKNGQLCLIKRSEIQPRDNVAQKRANEEFGAVPSGNGEDKLGAIASGGVIKREETMD